DGDLENEVHDLSPSMENTVGEERGKRSPDKELRGDDDRQGRKLTIWSTAFTTYTVTTTSVLTGTTATATLMCTAPGANAAQCSLG
ncbi:hypothetical protein SK128_015458, partial [Halocaridina rubra]